MANKLLDKKYAYCRLCGISFDYTQESIINAEIGRFNLKIVACPRCHNSVHIVPSVKDIARLKNSKTSTESL